MFWMSLRSVRSFFLLRPISGTPASLCTYVVCLYRIANLKYMHTHMYTRACDQGLGRIFTFVVIMYGIKGP
ncbi:hypothetical protein F5B21DRAFT_453051 [Xylaria acuta]|nr:hypothetical protein F5B21DRAFT_453051 [Xylaria acuta]